MRTRHPNMNRFNREGQLIVWRIVNPPNEGLRFPVEDIMHALQLISALAMSDLLDSHISSNAYGLEIFRDGEWEEWESEDCDDIHAVDDMDEGEQQEINREYVSKHPRR